MTHEPSAASVHDTSWSETILRLHVGEHAPVGYEIKRVVGHVQEPSGIGGTSWRDVYVVACRKCAMSSHDSAAATASAFPLELVDCDRCDGMGEVEDDLWVWTRCYRCWGSGQIQVCAQCLDTGEECDACGCK